MVQAVRAPRRALILAVLALVALTVVGVNQDAAWADIATFTPAGGLHFFTVPAGVTSLRITAWGAGGGATPTATGGSGASIRGDFSVTPGEVLSVVAGDVGGSPINIYAGGGGGGSFAWRGAGYSALTNVSLLVAAGGGGGGSGCGAAHPGFDASLSTSGTSGNPGGNPNAPGNGGNRGGGVLPGGGGGGVFTSGGNGSGGGGEAISFGAAGGTGGNASAGDGGFGGGGGGMLGGGGGGGYSGGGGGNGDSTCTMNNGGGGGGGSFNAGANVLNLGHFNSGTGKVTIEYTPLTVTIDQASTQPDPATSAPVNFTAVFSQPVSGFTGADVSFAGSTAPGTLTATVTPAGPATTYNVAVSGMTGPGTVVVSIPDNAVTPANAASTSTDNTVTFQGTDGVPPTCRVTAVRRAPNSPSGRDEMDVSVDDTGSGLQAVTNATATNGTVVVSPANPFPPGTTHAVVTAVKFTQGTPTTWSFDVVDRAGNTRHCA